MVANVRAAAARRHASGRLRMLGAAATVLALAGPSSALANHVTPGASSATCDKLTVQFDAFGNANKPITYSVKVDGAVVKTGSFTSTSRTFPMHELRPSDGGPRTRPEATVRKLP